ncbi:hypothetical protein ZHAS_00011184 [Anopheles sinensis]|uniref:Uncharacterized protein n=1 Tax=Anopheles sinensis TaxID=74873 RepID=A0A084VZH8_ANOSI|nr:hypothetical protein ZHAS_00011184 [Anopheles sinensis]
MEVKLNLAPREGTPYQEIFRTLGSKSHPVLYDGISALESQVHAGHLAVGGLYAAYH